MKKQCEMTASFENYWDWDIAVEISEISVDYLNAGRFIDDREKESHEVLLTLRISHFFQAELRSVWNSVMASGANTHEKNLSTQADKTQF